MNRAILATANQLQAKLGKLLDELSEVNEQQQKLLESIEKLTKENEGLRIQLQECQMNSAQIASIATAI
jgi:regulator of replication initiation timing